MCTFIFYKYFLNLEDTRCLNFQTEFLTKGFQRFLLSWCLFLVFFYICHYLFISHHNVFRNFRWNGRSFSSYCCGNVVEFSHVPTLIPRFVQCVTGLFRLLLGCSACYWLVPLVPCFSNVGLYNVIPLIDIRANQKGLPK